MTRSLLKRWRKPKPDDVPVRLPFSNIMEFAITLLSSNRGAEAALRGCGMKG